MSVFTKSFRDFLDKELGEHVRSPTVEKDFMLFMALGGWFFYAIFVWSTLTLACFKGKAMVTDALLVDSAHIFRARRLPHPRHSGEPVFRSLARHSRVSRRCVRGVHRTALGSFCAAAAVSANIG